MQIDIGMFQSVAGLTTIAAGVLALVAVLFPPARRWFEGLEGDVQRAITGGVVLFVAALATAASCLKVVLIVPCTVGDILGWMTTTVAGAVLGLNTAKGVFGAAKALSGSAGRAARAARGFAPAGGGSGSSRLL